MIRYTIIYVISYISNIYIYTIHNYIYMSNIYIYIYTHTSFFLRGHSRWIIEKTLEVDHGGGVTRLLSSPTHPAAIPPPRS